MPKTATAQIHAILGSDDAEVKRIASELAARLGKGGEFGSDVIDGHVENSEQASQRIFQTVEALNTFGFFGGEKLVWLKNANFLADDRTGNSAATLEAMEKLTELLNTGLPDGTSFILSAGAVDKRRSFYKTLGKVAEVEVHDRIDSSKAGWEESAGPLVRRGAEARGLRFEEEALDLFTMFTGGDRRVIDNELEKLDLYLAARRTVRPDDVRLLTPLSRAGVVFELGNALAERRLERALELLKQLFFQGENAVGILLVAIIPTVRNLFLVKDLMTRNKGLRPPSKPFYFGGDLEKLGAAAIAHLPRTKEGKLNAFPLGIAAVNAKRYTLPELQSALTACLEANVSLVSAPTDSDVILSQLLVRIIAA